jgi:carbamoylphosphate synthase large subunit
MIEKKERVLISSAGTGNAFAAIKALRKNFKVEKIVTIDINPARLVTASLFSDEHIMVPRLVAPEFLPTIKDIVKRQDISTYVPFIDYEVFLMAELCEHSNMNCNLKLQVRDITVANTCLNKLEAYKYFVFENIPTPRTSSVKQPFSASRYVVKPINGSGSKVRIITEAELNELDDHQNMIIQDVCDADEVTVDVSWSEKYNVFNYICRERIETKSGVCTKARLFWEDSLEVIARQLSMKLGLHSFCFQVMKLNGAWVVTDLNPRLGAGSSMSEAVGYDFYSAMFAIMWDLNPSQYFGEFRGESYVTRQYSDYLMQ